MKTSYELHLEAENDNLRDRIKELEAENARIRQQRDAANAQLDFILENMKCDRVSEPECKHEFVYQSKGWQFNCRYGYVCRFCGEHQK